jgi:hypothetical protein
VNVGIGRDRAAFFGLCWFPPGDAHSVLARRPLVQGAFLCDHEISDDATYRSVFGSERTFSTRMTLAETVVRSASWK